mgnify:CR=1 FL=1
MKGKQKYPRRVVKTCRDNRPTPPSGQIVIDVHFALAGKRPLPSKEGGND